MAGMESQDLKLRVGESMQLQPRDGDDARRMHVKLIGYLKGASLLVTTPRVGDKVMIIREGQPFVVRMMVGNDIVGFATTVLRVCARPYPYLHLSYPDDDQMQQITVRQAQRVRLKLFASLKNTNPDFAADRAQPATIVDMSTGGALVVAPEPLGDLDDEVTLSCAVKIGGAEKLLSLPALIRSVQTEPGDDVGSRGYAHGLQFQLTSQPDTLALHAFVYEQIVLAQSD